MKWLAGLLVLIVPFASAIAAVWDMTPQHGRLEFMASYQGESVPGLFREFHAEFQFDPDNPADSELNVVVNIGSLDMGSADFEEGAATQEWFDMARFPGAEFRSRKIRRIAPNRFEASGELTLKGISQEVVVPFTWVADGQGAVMTGELQLLRTAFAIGTGEWATGNLVGFNVKVKYRVNWRRAD